jgi:hypothetical protein
MMAAYLLPFGRRWISRSALRLRFLHISSVDKSYFSES